MYAVFITCIYRNWLHTTIHSLKIMRKLETSRSIQSSLEKTSILTKDDGQLTPVGDRKTWYYEDTQYTCIL